MKVTFWLLDLNYEVRNGAPELWLWGIGNSGKRLLVIDRHFKAYFYAVIEEETDPEKIIEQINNSCRPYVAELEIVERRFFGKPVKAVKVYCNTPDLVSKCARELRDFEGVRDCFEDDIRYSMRYMIDNNVVPCGWHEVEAVEEKSPMGIQINETYVAESAPKFIERTDVPPLRILGFSAVYYSREGTPKPERNPVVLISAATNCDEQKQFLADEDRNDKPVLKAFIAHIKNFDPDIIVGYGTNGQDWHYLAERCKKHGLQLCVDRAMNEPHTSVYSHVSLTGRVNLDLADYADEFPEVKVKTLENLADYLGIMKLENRVRIEDIDIANYWSDKSRLETLKKYSADNVCSIMGIAKEILGFSTQLASLVGLPLDHVGTAAAGFRVEWFLIKHTHKIGELIPKRIEQPYRPYAGGLVLQPKPGLHDSIAVLDFKSMYPNIMITYNLSPDTYISPKEPLPSGGIYEAPEVKHRFRKEPPGFYKEVLSYLIRTRNELRLKMKKLRPESVEYRVLDARQKAVKIITNASYGYAGWTGARWYVKPVAEAAAAWGRYLILATIKMAEENKLKVVYGDTDSIFMQNEPEKITKLSEEIKTRFGLEINLDKVYVRIFFTEAKKRYAGLLADGRLDIVGMEVVRGDWAGIAKTVQEKVLEIVLKEQSPEKAKNSVLQFIRELRQKRVPYRSLIIWKTLTKPAEEYEIKASHVEAAKMLMEKGWEFGVGDKIGYVVVVGEGRLYEKIKPYVFATYDEVDIGYYVNKQIVPAAVRILESFGITEDQFQDSKTEEKETKKLSDFFGS